MGHAHISPATQEAFLVKRRQGFNIAAAAREVGVSYAWAKSYDMGWRNSSGKEYRAQAEGKSLKGPIPLDQLGTDAAKALEDFEYFRRRYMGHVSTPWQLETAARIVDLLALPDKAFVVENCPPGTGKTTLLHDVAAWVTVRDRRIRGLFGSRAEGNANRQLRRLRRTFERTSPARARSELVERGLAVDAEACLAVDYGLFRPATSDVWRGDEFIVAQFDDVPIEEKEPTWSSYGMDSAVLGNRFNLILWDDVVDRSTTRTLEAQEGQRLWWDEEAETRLEPEGVLFLVGQRMSASDLYRYCLDKRRQIDEDEEDESVETDDRPIYQHIIYKAHYEDRCAGRASHRRDALAYPDGCLLDPYRLPWSGDGGLRALSNSKVNTYLVSYQQEDADPEKVLVKRIWVDGGTDPETGTYHAGCWDGNRGLCELPEGLVQPLVSVASVDPSGTKMWAVEWWVHAPEAANQSFLMDIERKSMPANELLDWDANKGEFYGLMENWQARSVALGYPIKFWIVEVNAAQRYLLAYDHVRRWMSKWGVSIVAHTTGPRKLDENWGPWTMRDLFRHGRIRLPGARETKNQPLYLVNEATRWPNAGTTDDCVMAAWFQFLHLPDLIRSAKVTQADWNFNALPWDSTRADWRKEPALV